MLTKLSKIMTKVIEFNNKHNVEMELHLYKVNELKNESENETNHWATFEKSAGLFCIFGDDSHELKNIRKNTKAIGGALYKILFKDEKAQTKITDNNMVLVIVMKQEAYMASSLKNYINKMAL